MTAPEDDLAVGGDPLGRVTHWLLRQCVAATEDPQSAPTTIRLMAAALDNAVTEIRTAFIGAQLDEEAGDHDAALAAANTAAAIAEAITSVLPPPDPACGYWDHLLHKIRHYLTVTGWTQRPPGEGGAIWTREGHKIGVWHTLNGYCDAEMIINGILERIAAAEGRPTEAVRADISRAAIPRPARDHAHHEPTEETR